MEDRERRLEEATEALDEEDYERVLTLLERTARRPDADGETCALYGLALYYLGEGAAAAPALDRALEEFPEEGELQLARALIDYHQVDPEAAVERLRTLAAAEPEAAEIRYWLGRVLDWWSEEKPEMAQEAAAELAAAARLDPEEFPPATVLEEREFERILSQAIERLPEPVRRAADEVAILVERYPSRELLADAGDALAPDLLGLYTGTPLPERSTLDSGRPPDVIHVFRRNLEFLARSGEEMRDEIRITLLHEIGHYLGMDEPDLERIGLE